MLPCDDDDVSKHEAKLEQIHKALVTKEPHRALTDDSKENEPSLFYLNEDPVCLRILREREGPIQNVFARPFASPAKHGDVFEFDSSECKHSNDSESRPMSATSMYSSSSSSRPCSALSGSHTPSLSRRRRQRLQKLREAIIACHAGEDDEEFVPPVADMESSEAENTPKMMLRPRRELWNTDDDLALADIQLQVVLEKSKKDLGSFDACSGSKSSKINVPERYDDDDFAFLPSADLCTPRTRSKRTSLGDSNSVPTDKRKRKRHNAVLVSKDQRGSDADEDLPLSHFVASRSGTAGQNGSRSMSRKRKLSTNYDDDDYKAPYTDAPLSEIRRRYRSMRRRDGLKQRKIDYSDMDWDD
ncbi:unnamed protein product [Cylicocyclus nassatus]|uniref:Uncharacterized protein n=1 Tax=Cylicocyclus nassatus TaxID=53992 RepID=A0AA36GL64_CYLNA|nr:unnamed protein product [Cylicocyclus nassatus]